MEQDCVLNIENIQARVDQKPILKGIDLAIRQGEIHALMGPNGSGKSTLANILLKHPGYEVTAGQIRLAGQNILDLSTDERARLGLFLAFQYPVEIAGISVTKFLKQAVEAGIPVAPGNSRFSLLDFVRDLKATMEFLEMPEAFADRYLNAGFSGGEKKRMEILQMLMLKPKFAILDETDSGLDVDALRVVARGVNRLHDGGRGAGVLIITHYQRILNYIKPDRVHIMHNGRIVTSGGPELVDAVEQRGYEWIKEQFSQAA
jgi:Fe-S cluster assembly ATP-binding protein